MKTKTYLLISGIDKVKSPIISKTGLLLLNQGEVITENIKKKLINFGINEVVIY